MAKYKAKYFSIFIAVLFFTTFIVFKFLCRMGNTHNEDAKVAESCQHKQDDTAKTNNTKQYFASTKASNAIARCGPGVEYDIFCEYSKNTPLLIIDSHENWRLVLDFYGDKSWMHVSLLSTRYKSAMCNVDGFVYKKKNTKSQVLCRIQKHTIVHVIKIYQDMCYIEFSHDGKRYKGYMENAHLFGVTNNLNVKDISRISDKSQDKIEQT